MTSLKLDSARYPGDSLAVEPSFDGDKDLEFIVTDGDTERYVHLYLSRREVVQLHEHLGSVLYGLPEAPQGFSEVDLLRSVLRQVLDAVATKAAA